MEYVYSDTSNYRVPTFVIEADGGNEVVLNTLELSDNKHNVSYSNNCIRWLRRVSLIDETKSPYFSGSRPEIEMHLCSLYLHPGMYPDMNSIVVQMNQELMETRHSLFHSETNENPTTLVSVYTGEFPSNSKFEITNASFTSLDVRRLKPIDTSPLSTFAAEILNAVKSAAAYNYNSDYGCSYAFNYIQFARPDVYFLRDSDEKIKTVSYNLSDASLFSSNYCQSDSSQKISDVLFTLANRYQVTVKDFYPRNNAVYNELDDIQTHAINAYQQDQYFNSIISRFSDMINVQNNPIRRLAAIYTASYMQTLSLSLLNFILNTYTNEKTTYDKYNVPQDTFVSYPETIAISELCEKLSIKEINNATLYHIFDGYFSLRFPSWFNGTEVFLRGFSDVSKCWLDRVVNQVVVEAILNGIDVESALNAKIDEIHDALSSFYESFIVDEGNLDERNASDIDVDDENGWWHMLGYDFTSLKTCIYKLTLHGETSIRGLILSSIRSSIDEIKNEIAEIMEISYRTKFINPIYYYTLDNKRYLAIINKPSLINETNSDSFIVKNTEILPFNEKQVELIKSSKSYELGTSYDVVQGMISKYGTEYAERTYPEIMEFTTTRTIPLPVYVIKDDILMQVSENIPDSVILRRYTGDDIDETSRYYKVVELLQSLYTEGGVIKNAKLSEIQVSEEMLLNFDETLLERPIDETTIYITNKELLNDVYFDAMRLTDEPFSIINNNVYCNLTAIAPVSVGRIEGESGSARTVSFANTNTLYMKDIMSYSRGVLTSSLSITTNQYILSQYDIECAQIDNEYYTSTQSENGLAERLGLSTLAIKIPEKRKYIIKTHNYSEEVFDGNIELRSNIRIPGQNIPLMKGLTISKTLYSLVVQYLLNRNLIRIAEPALIIPSSISIYETNSSDIESIVNKGVLSNEIYSFDSNTNVVRFSSNIKLTIPSSGKLYIFVSNPLQPYVYGNGRYVLTFDRV